MTSNDLVALLHEVREWLKAYRDPNDGFALYAATPLLERIDLALSQPVEELPLREENLALRAALACWRNDEDWRLKYLASELEKGKLKEQLEWAVAVQKAALESQERLALEVKGWKQAAEIQEMFKNAAMRERDAARQAALDAPLPVVVSPLGIAVPNTPLEVSRVVFEKAEERDTLAQQNIELNDACVRYEKALKAARYSLGILASHLDDPNTPWPNYGLKSLAISYKKRVEEIDAVLKGNPK